MFVLRSQSYKINLQLTCIHTISQSKDLNNYMLMDVNSITVQVKFYSPEKISPSFVLTW